MLSDTLNASVMLADMSISVALAKYLTFSEVDEAATMSSSCTEPMFAGLLQSFHTHPAPDASFKID